MTDKIVQLDLWCEDKEIHIQKKNPSFKEMEPIEFQKMVVGSFRSLFAENDRIKKEHDRIKKDYQKILNDFSEVQEVVFHMNNRVGYLAEAVVKHA